MVHDNVEQHAICGLDVLFGIQGLFFFINNLSDDY